MDLKIEEIINGCPQFRKIEPVTNRSLLTENRTIAALKPSDQINNPVLLFICRLFHQILNWLYPFEKKSYIGIVSALDTHTINFQDVEKEELWTYFRRFFDAEGNHVLQTSADELKEQYQVITRFNDLSKKPEGNEQELAKCKELLQKMRTKIANLKEGEQTLVVFEKESREELFFLFSKSNTQTRLKVVGRGALLTDLSDLKEAIIAGQPQVVASLDYGPVSDALINQLLDLTPLRERPAKEPSSDSSTADLEKEADVSVISALKKLLNPLRPQKEGLPDLTVEAKNNLEFLLNVFNQVGKNQGQSVAHHQRMQLRFELFTLFSYLKEIRKQWTAAPQDIYALRRMLQICSKHLFDAYQTKLISQVEQQTLLQELLAVEKSLDQIKIDAKKHIDSCDMPSMQIYRLKEMEALQPALNVQMPVVMPVKQERTAHTLPEKVAPLRLVRTQNLSQIDDNRPIPEQLKSLTLDATEQQIVRTIVSIPFNPFTDKRGEISATSPWNFFSEKEAEEMMSDLCLLSEKLGLSCLKEKTLSIDVYGVLLKMTAMISFLTYNPIQKRVVSPELDRLLRHVRRFMKEADLGGRRLGYTIDAQNMRIIREINALDSSFSFITAQIPTQALIQDRSTTLIEGLEPLQKQLDLLTYLMPHHLMSSNSILPILHHWIAPLPLSLLAVYCLTRIEPGYLSSSRYQSSNKKSKFWNYSYRDTPESIQHDPVSAIKEFEGLLMDEITKWRESVGLELDPRWNFLSQVDILLDNSPYKGAVREARLQEALIQEKRYLFQAMQADIPLSQEEWTALLSLLRGHQPQTIVMDFIQTHRKLLLYPAIRSFVHLIFFDCSLPEILENDKNDLFARLLPTFLKEKIQETLPRIQEHPEERVLLVLFLQMSERLSDIYASLRKSRAVFFKVEPNLIHSLIEACDQKLLNSDNLELIFLPLKLLLREEELSQQQMCQIISGMHLLKVKSLSASFFDRRELFWLNDSYKQLIKEIQQAGCLDKAHIDYLLDKICVQNNFVLENSPWTGTFPEFNNGRYSINLMTLTVKDQLSEAQKIALPSFIFQSPSFIHTFPDLNDPEQITALWMMADDGTKIYFFEDAKKHRCRVEQRGENITCYRTFSHTGSQWLQAPHLKSLVDKQEDREPPSLFDLFKKKGAEMPILFKGPLFFDPQVPHKAYVLSDESELAFELHIKQTQAGQEIAGVIDLRTGAEPVLKQVVSCSVLTHPGLKQLEQIENPEYILVWGAEKGEIEKVELPRYGLQFTIRDGALICTTPGYAGYQVCLGASLEERRGLPCSLLLETRDRKSHRKLLLPPARALCVARIPELYSYTGVARFIAWIKIILFSSNPEQAALSGLFRIVPQFGFKPLSRFLKLTCIDLRPHSQEMLLTKGQEAQIQQELIQHALAFGLSELALDSVNHVSIEKEEKALNSWIHFLNSFTQQRLDSVSAALFLKLAEKLHEPLKGRKKYNRAFQQLLSIEEKLLQSYTKTLLTLPASYRLSQERFKEIAERVKDLEPQEYQKWFAPFFLSKGDSFTIPLITPDNLESLLLPMPASQELPAAPKLRLSSLNKLEKEIEPERAITRELLKKSLKLETGRLLLFKEEVDLTHTSLDTLLKKIILPKRKTLESEKEEAKEVVKRLCRFSLDSVEQLAILASEKEIASFSDLSIALMQNDLRSLQSRLPTGIDLTELKKALITFYDLEVQLHLIIRKEEEARALLLEKGKSPLLVFEDKVKLLKEQMLYKRQYDPDKNPELLAFEAFHFVTFRNGLVGQLELLEQLLNNSASIVQAGTGSGKSSVLSVLRALMRASGENLVTQKVLPHLYQETLTILQTRLSSTFKRKVYPLRFSQTARLVDPQGRSLFQEIYYQMLITIKNKGCVLTDYKSYVLFEQKFFSLSQLIAANAQMQTQTPLITYKHWFYLAKILHLLKNRNDELMDEFDEPLSAKQRIQTQIKEGELFEKWMIEASLHIYQILREIPELFLTKNLQVDLSDATRKRSIEKLALRLAGEMQKAGATKALIYDYLLGKNENVLAHLQNWTPQERDYLAFCKDQCCTYLPLTLDRAASSNYARSEDGSKIVICSKGQKREAKFGNPVEEINYTIQYYLQCGVARATLRSFVLARISDWKEAENQKNHEETFAFRFPGASLCFLASLAPDDFEDQIDLLLSQVNQNPQIVWFFLERHLYLLKTSGMVISMTPQDSVAMSLAVSGVSATRGSLGSLHTQFEHNEKAADSVQEEMIKRAKRRAYSEHPMMTYDPHDPLALLSQLANVPQLCALIDGSDACRSLPAESVAKALLRANKNLTCVEYYDEEGNIISVGDPSAPLAKKGFYFSQAQTRGSDQLLDPDGVALVFERKKGGIEDFLQVQGRMRHDRQKLIVALPSFDSIDSLDALIALKESYEKQKNSEDRYRAELQRLDHFVRDAARSDLLNASPINAIENILENPTLKKDPELKAEEIQKVLAPFLQRFEELSSLLITSESARRQSGNYFENNQHLIKCDANPVAELSKYQRALQEKCGRLKLFSEALDRYRPQEAEHDLPTIVFPKHAIEKSEQEVEEELENELAQEEEMEVAQEQQLQKEVVPNKVSAYLPRKYAKTYGKRIPAAQLLSGPFDPRIILNDSYLPQNRKNPLHKRTPFDDRMGRIRSIQVVYSYEEVFKEIRIGDFLHQGDLGRWVPDSLTFWYDIQIGKVIEGDERFALPFSCSREFQELTAQIKFMDGMLNGYTKLEELFLRSWLQENNPARMERYFCTKILQNRPLDRDRFPTSQLAQIFEAL